MPYSSDTSFEQTSPIRLPRVKSSSARWLTAVAGFIGYGAWAFFANSEQGSEIALKAGVTQGSISFLLTFGVNLWVEWLYLQLYEIPLAKILASVIASLSIIGLSASINLACGTPNWKMTILPGSLICTLYVFSYLTFNLKKR